MNHITISLYQYSAETGGTFSRMKHLFCIDLNHTRHDATDKDKLRLDQEE